MPTLGERIVEHLTANEAPLDEGELAEALGVPRPVVTETCRQLKAQGLLVSNVVGSTWTVSVVPASSDAAPDRQDDAAPAAGRSSFSAHARRVLSGRWGTTLQQRPAALSGGVTHPFDLVSGNGRIVGDVVRLADRGDSVEAKWAAIAEAVLIVGHVTQADRRFLVFGEDWDVLSRWLARYRPLLDGVEMWFLEGDRLERLA